MTPLFSFDEFVNAQAVSLLASMPITSGLRLSIPLVETGLPLSPESSFN
jgi:hypothetical protein